MNETERMKNEWHTTFTSDDSAPDTVVHIWGRTRYLSISEAFYDD